MREQFRDYNFQPAALRVIEQANTIIDAYQRDGLTLTLRQLYYRFVGNAWIENSDPSYKRLGSIINKGRLAGLIDWDAIEDRTRNLDAPNLWDSPRSIVNAVARQYKEDPWDEQPNTIEVWVEKEALAGVVERACEDLRVPFLSCRGYLSQSEAYAAGKRVESVYQSGQHPVIIHLGDHDPSGIDMTRDNIERIREFSSIDEDVEFTFTRLALNMDQIRAYNPPPNPAKVTDSRSTGYIRDYGRSSWELDALEPNVLIDLIRTEIELYIDQEKWDATMEREAERREDLRTIAVNYDAALQAAKDA